MADIIVPREPHKGFFMFPDSYINLRKELHQHWPDLWRRAQWAMAFDAEMFVEIMQQELQLPMLLVPGTPEAECDYWCSKFLTALRKKRGAE